MQLQRLQDYSRRSDALHFHCLMPAQCCKGGLAANCCSFAGGFGIQETTFVPQQSWPGGAQENSSFIASVEQHLKITEDHTLPSFFMHEINGATNRISYRGGMVAVSP